MTEGKVTRWVLLTLGIIAVLFVSSTIIAQVLEPFILRSYKELGLPLRFYWAVIEWVRVYALLVGVAVLCIWGVVFWGLMLVDILKRDFAQPVNKIAWTLILFLPGLLGAVLFHLLGFFLFSLGGAFLYYFAVKRIVGVH